MPSSEQIINNTQMRKVREIIWIIREFRFCRKLFQALMNTKLIELWRASEKKKSKKNIEMYFDGGMMDLNVRDDNNACLLEYLLAVRTRSYHKNLYLSPLLWIF